MARGFQRHHRDAMHPERVDHLVLINSLPGASAWSQLGGYSETPVPPLGAFCRDAEYKTTKSK